MTTPNNRREYFTRYREQRRNQRSEAARTYREDNRDQINLRRQNARRRNMAQSRSLDENEYLGETLSDDIPQFSIGTLTEECNNCHALSFPLEHGRTKHNCCHSGKVELPYVEYPEVLKNLLLGRDSDSVNFRQNIRSYNSSFAMAAFCPSQEISFKRVSCVTIKGDVNVMATTSLIPANNQTYKFAQIYIQDNDNALSSRISDRCIRSVLLTLQNFMQGNPYAQVF